MTFSRRLVIPLVFLGAALIALFAAFALAASAERLTRAELERGFQDEGLNWVEARIDGLSAHLSGQAPDEGARITALRVASEVVGAARLSDDIEVPTDSSLVAPVFRIEAMRNQEDISLIGLVPHAMGGEALVTRIAAISRQAEVADMLQTADHPAPPGWELAVNFVVEALRRLPVAQVSATAGRIEVHALVDSPEAQSRLTAELRAIAPRGQVLVLDLNPPRPVVAPYLLRFIRDEAGARLDTCVADTEAARDVIERAARAAGLSGRFSCTIGLGSPSPRWAQAVDRAIAALARIEAGTVTLADQSVILEAPDGTDRGAFDRTVARLEGELPPAFSLVARLLPPADAELVGPEQRPEIVATLSEEGLLAIAGRLPDARIRDAVGTYARARFGSQAVSQETRLDPALPDGWSMRVLAGLEAMTQINHGRLLVTDERIELSGVSGNPDVTSQVTGVLTSRLGGAEGIVLRLRYDERLDPVAQEPNPERCEAWVQQAMAERKITFDPGSARLNSESNAILDDLAEILRNCGELAMEVAGHTDSQGRDETNLSLSQSRAEAVVSALSARGVLVASYQARGYGSAHPVADNATEAGREANRRIAISLIRPEPALEDLDEDELAELEAALEIEVRAPEAEQTRPQARPQGGAGSN